MSPLKVLHHCESHLQLAAANSLLQSDQLREVFGVPLDSMNGNATLKQLSLLEVVSDLAYRHLVQHNVVAKIVCAIEESVLVTDCVRIDVRVLLQQIEHALGEHVVDEEVFLEACLVAVVEPKSLHALHQTLEELLLSDVRLCWVFLRVH